MNCSTEQPGRTGVHTAPEQLCRRALKHHMKFLNEGARIATHAEAGRLGDRQPLVLPSHNGRKVMERLGFSLNPT